MIDVAAMRAASGIGQNMPNIIGNQEDKEGSSSYAPSSKPIFDPNKSGYENFLQRSKEKEGGQGGDEQMYRSITPRRTEAQKERMQQQ